MKELRCIVFSDNELLAAILDRRRKLKEPMPEGEITGLNTEMGDGLKVNLELDGGKRTLALAEHEVQGALLAYCMAKNVPLPVEADKMVYLIRGKVTLMITMNFNKQPRLVGGAAASAGR
ncbi:hypothetical protein HHL28_07280 [Aerophototrophica crusticola]|uniref:Uncharacterized protein n=2 Tax=Aerophototrophica crusticola TaxID=1709002 RepID=A0A858RD09_9PROT|nr:hypothetical protein HHL28_07280 [Rhodospirillaceae bacterium B3]